MRSKAIFLRLAEPDERELYRDKLQPCMIDGGELVENDTLVIAYRMNDLSYHYRDVALFLYEELTSDIIDSFSIVNLSGDKDFERATVKMMKFLRSKYKVILSPVARDSQLVEFCDRLYERVGEEKAYIIFDLNKLKRRRKKSWVEQLDEYLEV